jgi:hypothetical protein
MKSPGRFVVLMLLSFVTVQVTWGLHTMTSTGFSQAGDAQVDPCSKERAELKRLSDSITGWSENIKGAEGQIRGWTKKLIYDEQKLAQARRAGGEREVAELSKSVASDRNEIEEFKRSIVYFQEQIRPLQNQANQLQAKIAQGCPTGESSGDVWEKAIGKWGNKSNTLQFELQDLNRADREYYRNTPVKLEGYVVKQKGWSPAKIKEGDILFISNSVNGNTISGRWLNGPQETDCPKMLTKFSDCTIRIDAVSDTLTVEHEAMLYSYPECKWSTETRRRTSTYYRIK